MPADGDDDDGTLRAAPRVHHPRFWLVEDSPLEASQAQKALGAGATVTQFTSGEALIEHMATRPAELPDVVILDWEMPGMSGVEVCRFLRRRHHQLELPVLMLTVHLAKEDVVAALVAGANDYVGKPFHEAELRVRATGLLRLKRLHDGARAADADLVRRAAYERHLIGIVSHDLKNPVSTVALAAALIDRAEVTDPGVQKNLHRIQRAAVRASELIRDLLDFSLARSEGGIPIERAPGDLHELCTRVVEEARFLYPDREVTHVPRGDGAGAWARARLEQVVTNLVQNAVQYGAAGTPVVVTSRGAPGTVTVEVHNQGAPITDETRARMFEPMQRHGASVPDARSVGLGLFIVREIVRAHGGTIDVTSSAADGTTVAVTLPRG